MTKALVAAAALLGLVAAEARAQPVITFYEKHGVRTPDCQITMAPGTYPFESFGTSCRRNQDHYFSLNGNEDDLEFGIYADPRCGESAPYATFRLERGFSLTLQPVDVGRGLTRDGYIDTGLKSGGDSRGGKLRGEVSCVRVWRSA
jgi:hypothetical protein